MRVIHLAAYHGLHGGGFAPMLLAGAAAGRAHGLQVEAAFPGAVRGRGWVDEIEAGGVPVRIAPERGRARRAWLAEWLAERPGPTILHTHYTDFDVDAALVARAPDTHVIWQVHTVLSTRQAVRLRNIVKFGGLGRRVAAILAVAPHLADRLRARRAPAERVLFFPNPFDPDRFALVDPARRAEARARLGLPPEARVLMHSGRDWQLKGGDVFLRTVQRMDAVALCHNGGEPARAGAEALGLADRVHVVGAVDDMALCYHAADLFVSSSRADAMPFTVAEALSAGIPVVATDLPGQRWLGGRFDACAIAPLDPDALAAAGRDLLARPPERLRADIAEARRWLGEHMHPSVWGERVTELHRRVFAGEPVAQGFLAPVR